MEKFNFENTGGNTFEEESDLYAGEDVVVSLYNNNQLS